MCIYLLILHVFVQLNEIVICLLIFVAKFIILVYLFNDFIFLILI